MDPVKPFTYIGMPCPKHCGGDIIYNGTYSCEYWDISCDWKMSSGPMGKPVGIRDNNTMKAIQATPWYKRATGQ
jgi:hypothetical protein